MAQDQALNEEIHNQRISQNIQKLIAEDSMEDAVNNLIEMFPNEFIFNFLCYNDTRLHFHEEWNDILDAAFDDTKYTQYCVRRSSLRLQNSKPNVCQLLAYFSAILSKRFHISNDELCETTWGVFNYFFIKRYSKRWLDTCCTGEVGERDLEKYLLDCFNDEMISIYDAEAIALFTYYYCTVISNQNENTFYYNQPTAELYNGIIGLLKKYNAERKSDNFEAKLFGNRITQRPKNYYTIEDVDEMTGSEFEVLIANLFHSMKFTTRLTKAS